MVKKRKLVFSMKENHPGFTLIELLVVISIIALLVGLAMVSFGGAQKQSRDTQRKSDLHQYQSALENFASAHDGLYISRTGANIKIPSTNVCEADGDPSTFNLKPDYISGCPGDPGQYSYSYRSDGNGSGTATATKYALWVQLETGGFWEVCSDGRSGVLTESPDVTDGDALGNCELP